MAKFKNLIVAWNWTAQERSINVFDASGKVKEVKLVGKQDVIQGEKEFISLLDEYGNEGWEVVGISTANSAQLAFIVRAILKKSIE